MTERNPNRRLDARTLEALDAWWRASTYLGVGQIYLRDNALLRRPLAAEDIKPRLLGHFGTVPGLNLVYAHTNRVIWERGVDALFIAGPGHGGPALNASAWLEGTYSERYRDVPRDEAGARELFRRFSTPGGVPSHTAPETPGSIQEGGELGYSLAHAQGAALDNPGLTVVCVVGDGEAETGPLAASWHGGRFLHPSRDGAVLPVLHLNGWKIANPTLLARIPERELVWLMRGYGYEPIVVTVSEGEPLRIAHERLAAAMDDAFDGIAARREHRGRPDEAPRPPMIVLRSPKGWSGPADVDGKRVEGTWRSHQVPLAEVGENDEHRRLLEEWMRSYRPEELFDDDGAPAEAVLRLAPAGDRRMSANPRSNGGSLRRRLDLPSLDDFAIPVPAPGESDAAPTEVAGEWLASVIERNPATFRVFSPDEAESNRIAPAVYRATEKQWNAETVSDDEHLASHGQVMEVLSEHLCQGWMEGYTLTGRQGLFTTYEAFTHIVDSMFNQYAKWLEASAGVSWREPLPGFTYLLSSHVWQQDHNGFTHQDPGFIDVVLDKSQDIVRVLLPVDANSLLVSLESAFGREDSIDVVVSGKKPAPQWFSLEDARAHLRDGAGVLPWAGTAAAGERPDVVLAAAGDTPTQEAIAAAQLLRTEVPSLSVRVVNVMDLGRLQQPDQHPEGLDDDAFDAIFTADRPVVFAYHGYPKLIHRLTYRRKGHGNFHVHGYSEQGTTTTAFDMLYVNDTDRYRLAVDAIDRVPGLADVHGEARARLLDTRDRARQYTRDHGVDLPEYAEWSFDPRGA